jgi:hypothetical protein
VRVPTLCSTMRPQESRLLGTSRFDIHASLTPRHFMAHKSFVPPIFHLRSAMAHTTPAVRISLSCNLAISVSKFSDLFSRGTKTQSLTQIQWSSCTPDSTVVLLLPLRDLMNWSTQMLDSQPVNSRVHETYRSLATCPLRWVATNILLLHPHEAKGLPFWASYIRVYKMRISLHTSFTTNDTDLITSRGLIALATQPLMLQLPSL